MRALQWDYEVKFGCLVSFSWLPKEETSCRLRFSPKRAQAV